MSNFGTDRDLIFFPTEEFLDFADDALGSDSTYSFYSFSSIPEYVTGADGIGLFMGSSTELISEGTDLGKVINGKPRYIDGVWGVKFKKKIKSKKKSDAEAYGLVKGNGSESDLVCLFDGKTSGITGDTLKKISEYAFELTSSDTEWYLGFASNPDITFVETDSNFNFLYLYTKNGSNCFSNSIVGTGGDLMVGTCTAAEWFAVSEFGTNVTGTDMLTAGTDVVMKSGDPSLYLRFDFNFSSADLVSGDDPIPYDHLFIYRGEGTAVDFVAELSEPDDARLNPGARVEAIFNVSAMEILRI